MACQIPKGRVCKGSKNKPNMLGLCHLRLLYIAGKLDVFKRTKDVFSLSGCFFVGV